MADKWHNTGRKYTKDLKAFYDELEKRIYRSYLLSRDEKPAAAGSSQTTANAASRSLGVQSMKASPNCPSASTEAWSVLSQERLENLCGIGERVEEAETDEVLTSIVINASYKVSNSCIIRDTLRPWIDDSLNLTPSAQILEWMS